MEYFNILNLIREPFSNSPDPEFFYRSRQHLSCLQQLEISLRLRRGLNVVIGEVGVGKTTICRQLIRRLTRNQAAEAHLILDPDYVSPEEFVRAVAVKLSDHPPEDVGLFQMKEIIKQTLFEKGVREKKNVVLIIDEGQKMPDFCIEVLREFLNYETNRCKLLQIVVFAQKEFKQKLKAHAYFADRINFYFCLEPLSFTDMRALIRFRIETAADAAKQTPKFSLLAVWAIYQATNGYPRKVVHICHQCVLAMIVKNQMMADFFLVRSCIQKGYPRSINRFRQALTSCAFIFVVGLILAANLAPYRLRSWIHPDVEPAKTTAIRFIEPPIEASLHKSFSDKHEKPTVLEEKGSRKEENRLQEEQEIASKPIQNAAESIPVKTEKAPMIASVYPRTDYSFEPVAVLAPKKPARMQKGALLSISLSDGALETTNEPEKIRATAEFINKAEYSIQMGAFTQKRNADRLRTAFENKGYDSYIFEAADPHGKIWYTVRTGRFEKVVRAREYAESFSAKESIPVCVVHTGSLKPAARVR